MKISLYAMVLTAALPVIAAEKPRAMFGVVTDDVAVLPQGVMVRAVRPESPASQQGLIAGDVILALNGVSVSTKADVRAVLAGMEPGQKLEVELLRGAERFCMPVTLAERPVVRKRVAASADAAVGGDRVLRPLRVDPAIRRAMAERRRAIIQQLAQLDKEFAPSEVSDHLQAIRHLARDANPNGRGWMLGEAGEVSLQFKDAAGVLVLHGANNELTLTVYGGSGEVTHALPLNTAAQRAAVPDVVIERLQKLR